MAVLTVCSGTVGNAMHGVVSTAALIVPLDGFPGSDPGGLLAECSEHSGAPLEPVELEIVRRCHFKKKAPVDGKKRLGCDRCGAAKHDPVHLGAPESFNVFASSGWSVYQAAKKRWAVVLLPLLEQSGLPKELAGVMVEGEATFPDRAARDQGNYRVILEKALGDVLQEGGWIEADDWTRYSFGDLAYRYERGVSRTRLMLFPRA